MKFLRRIRLDIHIQCKIESRNFFEINKFIMSFSGREIISINIGQAGIQIGNETWHLYNREHEISANGKLEAHGDYLTSNIESFYEERANGRYVPRSIFVDTETDVIDAIRRSDFRQFYHPDQLIAGRESAANNFVRGYRTIGGEIIDCVIERIRRMAERSNGLQGFLLCHSFGGGTGSGFTAKLMDRLMDEYSRLSKIQIGVYPAPEISSTVVEPYNAIFSTHSTLDQIDCSFMFDNQALYEIAQQKLSIDQPMYSQLNRLMSQVISSLTASLRFSGVLNVDLDDFRTNLVPFPRIHFPIAAYAPFTSTANKNYVSNETIDITSRVFQSDHLMMKCNLERGKYMACCALYRGDVMPKDINAAIGAIKHNQQMQFVDWCPTGFKIGINSYPPLTLFNDNNEKDIRGVSLFAANTSIKSAFDILNTKFDKMFERRAFVHWFLAEGMDLDEIKEARENLAVLEMDYEEVEYSK